MENQQIIGNNKSKQNSRAIGDVVAMQLASITYCSVNGSVKHTLKHALPNWELVWEPVETVGGNYAFIAHNGVQYVIAIRGSILNFSWSTFDNWFKEDLNIFEQVKWKYTQDTILNPMISRGASDGLENLNQLINDKGETLLDFVMKHIVAHNKLLCVTGHSLGGNLATVFSLWLQYQIEVEHDMKKPPLFSIVTFAAPTSWNKDFANLYDAAFTNSWKYYNVLDIVPFSACNILGLKSLFPAPAPQPDDFLSAFIDDVQYTLEFSEDIYDSFYYEVNQQRGSVVLNTEQKIYNTSSYSQLVQWFQEAEAQHDHNHYLHFLKGDSIKCKDRSEQNMLSSIEKDNQESL
jgi:triacylglycerol lipase